VPIIQLQQRLRELGRIRLGETRTTKGGKPHPVSLDTFRLTSGDQRLIESAAGMFGGQPEPWGDSQWQVTTETDSLDVVVPPADIAFSQWYELWSGGGCQRRCDGERNVLTDGPCECGPDPEDRECSPVTRLSVMLEAVETLGVWRVETHGYYAAVELGGAVQVAQTAASRGQMLPARLRLDRRQVKRPNQPQRDFVVPVLDVDVGPARLAQLTEPEQPSASLTPVPESSEPAPPIAEQAEAVYEPPQTRRTQAEIPATGVEPRTAEQAAEDESSDSEGAHDAWLAELDKAITAAQYAGVDHDWDALRGHAAYSVEHAEQAVRRARELAGQDSAAETSEAGS